jgi:hypothetical protein
MKNLIFIFLVICSVTAASAQEQTLIDDRYERGGFGSIVLKVTNINGERATLLGGRGGWIVDHSFIFGGGGYSLVSNVIGKSHGTNRGPTNLNMGFGGIDFEYIHSYNDLIHFSAGIFIGGGSISDKYEHDGFFALEPSVYANLNVTHFFRFVAGVSYRYVSGSKGDVVADVDLSGPSAILKFEFGNF